MQETHIDDVDGEVAPVQDQSPASRKSRIPYAYHMGSEENLLRQETLNAQLKSALKVKIQDENM